MYVPTSHLIAKTLYFIIWQGISLISYVFFPPVLSVCFISVISISVIQSYWQIWIIYFYEKMRLRFWQWIYCGVIYWTNYYICNSGLFKRFFPPSDYLCLSVLPNQFYVILNLAPWANILRFYGIIFNLIIMWYLLHWTLSVNCET